VITVAVLAAIRKKSANRRSFMSENLLVKNARLLDGNGGAPVEGQALLVKDGIIDQIGVDIEAEGARELDVEGATVMPGLIDTHVHLESVPGSYYRNDSEEKLWKYRKHQLKAYLACGVTTVLDNGISVRQLKQFNDHLDGGGVGPSIYALAPIFYPPGGYGDAVEMPQWGPFRASRSAEEVESLFEEYGEFDNVIGAKMTIEPGMGPSDVWEIHSPEMRKVIADAAERRGMPVHVHSLKEEHHLKALEMGAYRLAHAGYFKSEPSKEFLEKLKESGAYVSTTLASTVGQNLVMFNLDKLNDPLIELTVPRELIDTARDPKAWKETMFRMIRICSPKRFPSFLIRLILKIANMEKELTSQFDSCCRAIVRMHEAGIPVVAGTDSANWPLFLNYFHGPSTILELQMIEGAGLSNEDVLKTATLTAAEMMGKQNEIGTLEVGKNADMIIVNDDPLKNIDILRNISYCIKDGVAKTPKEWMVG
jgi:hypothetical protein